MKKWHRPDKKPAKTMTTRFSRYTGDDFDPYVSALGQLALAWNDLHEALAGLFWTVMSPPLHEGVEINHVPIHVWHSLRSDLAQREMLRAAVEHPNANWSGERYKWFAEDVVWILKKVMELSTARNDAIHSPLFLTPSVSMGPERLSPFEWTFNPRAIGLAKRRNLLGEFHYCRDVAIVLHDYCRFIGLALVNPGRTWPGRPGLPTRQSRRSSPSAAGDRNHVRRTGSKNGEERG
jgi:hypothetical protein